jgi:hypothetical protein
MSKMSFPEAIAAATYSAGIVAASSDENNLMNQLAIAWLIGCLIGIGIGVTDVAQAREVRRQIAHLMDVAEGDLAGMDPIVQSLMAAANP